MPSTWLLVIVKWLSLTTFTRKLILIGGYFRLSSQYKQSMSAILSVSHVDA